MINLDATAGVAAARPPSAGPAPVRRGVIFPEVATVGYAQLVNITSGQCAIRKRVAPNDLAASYLMNKLTGSGMCFGSAMPKAGGGLTQTELDTVRAWILSNAAP